MPAGVPLIINATVRPRSREWQRPLTLPLFPRFLPEINGCQSEPLREAVQVGGSRGNRVGSRQGVWSGAPTAWETATANERYCESWLPTVEIFPPGIDPTMIDATGNQVEEVNGDWCEGDAQALITDCGHVQY